MAVKLRGGAVKFEPLWTVSRGDWKSSPAWLPVRSGHPLVVTGYGIGNTGTTGGYGSCTDTLYGGVIALDAGGRIAWEDDFTSAEWIARVGKREGSVRGSVGVADIDGDGVLEVLVGLGCYGELVCFDGLTGAVKWITALGPNTIGTPSFGDLDGDGNLEVVIPGYDGHVWVLGA